MRKINKLGILVAVAVAAMLAQPVLAACGSSQAISNTGIITIAGSGYYETIGNPIGSGAFSASFWAAGTGDPTLGAGDDSGALAAADMLFGTGNYAYGDGTYYHYSQILLTDWAAGAVVDGCVNNAGASACTCVLMTEDGTDGIGYMALSSAQTAPAGFIIQGNIDLQPAPAPMILSSSRNGVGVDLMVTVPSPTEGLNLDANCAGGCLAGATYRVLAQEVPRSAPMPDSRAVADWTDISAGDTPLGQNAMVSSACGAADTDLYLTSVISFNQGFAGSNVSGNATLVNCGTTLATPEETPIKRRPNLDRPNRGGKQGRGR